MITFNEAQAVVEASESVREQWGEGFTVADYGWQNPDVYQIAVDTTDGVEPFDAPALLVDKHTGKLSEVYGLVGADPVPGLKPIGNPPQ